MQERGTYLTGLSSGVLLGKGIETLGINLVSRLSARRQEGGIRRLGRHKIAVLCRTFSKLSTHSAAEVKKLRYGRIRLLRMGVQILYYCALSRKFSAQSCSALIHRRIFSRASVVAFAGVTFSNV